MFLQFSGVSSETIFMTFTIVCRAAIATALIRLVEICNLYFVCFQLVKTQIPKVIR